TSCAPRCARSAPSARRRSSVRSPDSWSWCAEARLPGARRPHRRSEEKQAMRIAVFGLGYVGTVTATVFASRGHEVTGVDVNPGKVAMIERGTSPVVEPDIGELLASAVRDG